MGISPGTRLGPYEIVAPLGAGGMGEVWRARDTRLDRDVAIKILPAGLAENEQFRARFEREAKTISSLNHPSICTLFDVGEESALHYLVMELLEGESLADRIERGPLPLHDVLKFGQQIASALDAAHRKGIVHRDLKPGNVMLAKSGAKLLDFGLAHVAAEAAPVQGLTNLPTEAKPLTREGTILGTIQYMAPEQLEGIEADPRTDIFALGALLYEMATGRRAFQAESRTSLIAAIVSSNPEPVSSVTKVTPPALDHVVAKCLEKDPDDRWQSAHDVASELRWLSEAGSQAGVPRGMTVRRKSRERIAWALVAVLALVSGFLIARHMRYTGTPARVVRSTIPPSPGTALVPFDEKGLSLSPDGRSLAFVAGDENGTTRIWVRDLASSTAHPVAGTDGAGYPFWSPDGQSLGFFAGGELRRIDLRGGSPRRITDAPYGRGGSWGRYGKIIFAPMPSGASIMMVSADGGEPRPVTKLDPRTESTHRWPVFLPDGRHFLFIAEAIRKGTVGVGRLKVGSIDDPETHVLIGDTTNALYVEPDWLVHGGGPYLFASRFDAGKLSISGDPIPIVPEETAYWSPKTFIPFAASSDGTLVYLPAPSRESELVFFSREGRREESLGKAAYDAEARISPDGTKIAYQTVEAGARLDVWVRDLALGRTDRITDPSGSTSPMPGCSSCAPVFSPDSTEITYGCQGAGVSDICVKSLVDGSAARRVVESSEWKPSWSWLPDGSAMVVTDQNPKTKYDLVLATLEGHVAMKPLVATPANENYPAVSPDGRWFAYVSDTTGRAEVYVRGLGADVRQWQISTDGGTTPRWRGDEIIYAAPDGRLMVMPVETRPTFRPGQPAELFRLPSAGVLQDVSPDGKRILLGLPTESPSSIAFQLVTNWTALVRGKTSSSN